MSDPLGNACGIALVDLGRSEYTWSWRLQQHLADLRASGKVPDIVLLTEHNDVYTIGRTGNSDHLLAGEQELQESGVAVVYNDRGGDITYHGPGQLVGYPILDLQHYYCDLHRYLRDVEEVVIRALGTFGIHAGRLAGHTGVWIGQEKICAIGIKTSRWITMHGFALNVNTDLSRFGRIIPCGIFEKGVTSMQDVLGTTIDLAVVIAEVARQIGQVFGRAIHAIPRHEFMRSLPGFPRESAGAHHSLTIESM